MSGGRRWSRLLGRYGLRDARVSRQRRTAIGHIERTRELSDLNKDEKRRGVGDGRHRQDLDSRRRDVVVIGVRRQLVRRVLQNQQQSLACC